VYYEVSKKKSHTRNSFGHRGLWPRCLSVAKSTSIGITSQHRASPPWLVPSILRLPPPSPSNLIASTSRWNSSTGGWMTTTTAPQRWRGTCRCCPCWCHRRPTPSSNRRLQRWQRPSKGRPTTVSHRAVPYSWRARQPLLLVSLMTEPPLRAFKSVRSCM
jgi:hypothetical protein